MGMFIVKKDTEIRVIQQGLAWQYDGHWKKTVTKKDNVFTKEELVVDPTGISKVASVPSQSKTIGGYYAKCGYYGFLKDGWYILIPYKDVLYG